MRSSAFSEGACRSRERPHHALIRATPGDDGHRHPASSRSRRNGHRDGARGAHAEMAISEAGRESIRQPSRQQSGQRGRAGGPSCAKAPPEGEPRPTSRRGGRRPTRRDAPPLRRLERRSRHAARLARAIADSSRGAVRSRRGSDRRNAAIRGRDEGLVATGSARGAYRARRREGDPVALPRRRGALGRAFGCAAVACESAALGGCLRGRSPPIAVDDFVERGVSRTRRAGHRVATCEQRAMSPRLVRG